ncbi:hypothetical protein HNQ56_003827 [Anaerotaenia torta]|uniref:DUF4127 family protein n=1 Tax=Anaerotaenia torta TaxID=433293 RepID=UPI003D1FC070
MKLALLPLDSRPCSYHIPKDLASLGKVNCVMPPLSIMDFFKEPSQFESISKWVLSQAPSCDAMVISIEQLLYGGLICSRQNRISIDEARKRLNFLEQLKQANPHLKLYAANVLMRTTVSTLNAESKIWWEAVALYSKYSHLAELEDTAENRKQLDVLKTRIPQEVLSEFLSVRERNHAINLHCIELVHKGVLDFLLILQEDCSEWGIHKSEQRRLYEKIEALGLRERVLLHNGTDEATAELMCRAVSPEEKEVCIKWLPQPGEFVALFEDRPFCVNLESHLKTVNLHHAPSSDTILYIYVPKQEQGDFCADHSTPLRSGYSDAQYTRMASTIAEDVKQGRKVYVLDVAFANGGDIRLLEYLAKQIPLNRLYGYSAWNTACNALGTSLAQIVMAEGKNVEENQKFTLGRILDDVIYQSVIRPKLSRRLSELKLDGWNIEKPELAQELLEKELREHQAMMEGLNLGRKISYTASLRWPRIFEAAIIME